MGTANFLSLKLAVHVLGSSSVIAGVLNLHWHSPQTPLSLTHKPTQKAE